MRTKGFIVLPAILITLILGLVGYFIYKNFDQNNHSDASNTEKNAVNTPTVVSPKDNFMKELTYEEAQSMYTPISVSIGPSKEITTKPGMNAKTPITISNIGDEDIDVDVTIEGDNISWFNTEQVPEREKLKPKEDHKFNISFSIPKNVSTSDSQILVVKAIPKENPRMADSARVSLEVGPKAWFEYEKGVDGNPLKVSFKDLSMGDIVSWHWDFGDGTSSNKNNPPPHTYNSAERRVITLTVEASYGIHKYTRDIWFSN